MMLFQIIDEPTQYMGLKELLLAFFALAEVAVRLTPSEKDNSIVNKIVAVSTYLLDFMIPNRKKGGGRLKMNKDA